MGIFEIIVGISNIGAFILAIASLHKQYHVLLDEMLV